jgi:hypothetical protein
MRGFLCFLAILLFVMNLSKCPGCQRSFEKGGAIRVHQRSCNRLRLAANAIYVRREKNQQAVKLPRREGLSPEDLSDQRQDIRDEVNNINDLPHASSSKVSIFSPLDLP